MQGTSWQCDIFSSGLKDRTLFHYRLLPSSRATKNASPTAQEFLNELRHLLASVSAPRALRSVASSMRSGAMLLSGKNQVHGSMMFPTEYRSSAMALVVSEA